MGSSLRNITWKRFCFVITLTLAAFCADSAFAECVIYKGQYGYDALAHVSNGVIYRGQYGSDAVGHLSGQVVYRGQYGYDALAHIGNGVIYRGQYGSDAVGHLSGEVIYRGQYGYDALAHATGCSNDEASAAGAAFILGLL